MPISRRQILYSSMLCMLDAVLPTTAAEPKELPLEQYAGKVILADFWASWCVPCKKSIPWLNTMAEKYQQQGLVVLGINLDENRRDAERFLEQTAARFPIIYDPNGSYASHYQLKTMPSSLLFNREGQHVSTHRGFLSKKIAEYESRLITLLNS